MKEIPEKTAFEKLTKKQQHFVLEYLVSKNGTQSAIKAGYSESSAGSIASENLQKPEIRAAIDEKLNELWENREKELGRIWGELRAIGYAKLDDYIEWDGETANVKPFDEIDARALNAIKIKRIRSESNDNVDTEVIEVKFNDKLKALESMARMAGGLGVSEQIKMTTESGEITFDVNIKVIP